MKIKQIASALHQYSRCHGCTCKSYSSLNLFFRPYFRSCLIIVSINCDDHSLLQRIQTIINNWIICGDCFVACVVFELTRAWHCTGLFLVVCETKQCTPAIVSILIILITCLFLHVPVLVYWFLAWQKWRGNSQLIYYRSTWRNDQLHWCHT